MHGTLGSSLFALKNGSQQLIATARRATTGLGSPAELSFWRPSWDERIARPSLVTDTGLAFAQEGQPVNKPPDACVGPMLIQDCH